MYALLGPCDDTNSVGSFVVQSFNSALLDTFTTTEICAGEGAGTVTGALYGVITDYTRNPSDNFTRVAWLTGISDRARPVNMLSDTDPTLYSNVCTGASYGGSGGHQVAFRNDGTDTPFYWGSAANLLKVRTFATCAETIESAAALGGYPCWTDGPTIDCLSSESGGTLGNPNGWVVRQHDPTDSTTAVTVNATYTTDFLPDPVNDGLGAAAVTVRRVLVDSNGDNIVCGQVQEFQASGTQWSFLAKYSDDLTTAPVWNITELNSAYALQGCDLGKNGEIITWGHTFTPLRAEVRYYCCNDAGANRSQLQYDFIEVSGTPTGPSGNVVNRARDFCSDAWGFDCGWLIIIACTGIVVVAFSRVTQATPVMAIGGLLGLGLGVILTGTDFVWLLFLVAFLLIGLAAKTMFGGGGDGGTE